MCIRDRDISNFLSVYLSKSISFSLLSLVQMAGSLSPVSYTHLHERSDQYTPPEDSLVVRKLHHWQDQKFGRCILVRAFMEDVYKRQRIPGLMSPHARAEIKIRPFVLKIVRKMKCF